MLNIAKSLKLPTRICKWNKIMKTLEEIKKYFPNHKFKDGYDLILIQFTAEDLIDFSGGYAKKVAIASLEKASENAKLETFSTKNLTDFSKKMVDKNSITNEENIVL